MISKTKSKPGSEPEILKRLSAGLSKKEIQRVLAGALSSLDRAGVDRLLQGVGPEATDCLIDWEWRLARRKKMTVFQFVDRLCELEISTKGLGLDEKAVARFVRGLNEEGKQDVLKGIQAKREQNPWKQALSS